MSSWHTSCSPGVQKEAGVECELTVAGHPCCRVYAQNLHNGRQKGPKLSPIGNAARSGWDGIQYWAGLSRVMSVQDNEPCSSPNDLVPWPCSLPVAAAPGPAALS